MLFCEAGRMATQKPHLNHLRLSCDVDAKLPPVFGNSATIYDSVQRLMEAMVGHLQLSCNEVELTTFPKAGESHLRIRFPERPDQERLAEVRDLLSSEEIELQEASRYLPGFAIARGFVELHAGRIEVGIGDDGSCIIEIILPDCANNESV